MSEIRLNLITREWVIIPTDRPRPMEEFRNRANRHYSPEREEACPFCPGNEAKTPSEILRIPGDGPWRIRVTANKFSHLSGEGERVRVNQGMKRMVSGVGRHEIIVESPKHNTSLALIEEAHLRDLLDTYRNRFEDAFKDRRIQHVIVFKNHGAEAGSAISHPYSQVIGVPIVPALIRIRVDEFMRFFDSSGECLVCSTLRDELADGVRVIEESKHFVSFIPYAAVVPFHTWIFPKRHIPSFSGTEKEELEDLARVLRNTLQRLHKGLDNPSYNMAIRSLSPFRSRSEYLHWYLSITPRVTPSSGFELGTGIRVNNAVPEHVAKFLRSIKPE